MAREALLKSIVMLKNTDNSVIKPAGDEKLTVYIPYKYSPATTSRRGTTPRFLRSFNGYCRGLSVLQRDH